MIRKLLCLLLLSQLLACSTLEFPGVYRLQIEQGNIITDEMVAQLQPGLTRSQVEFIMGKPLIRDSFSPDRWDYVYTVRNPDKSVEKTQVTVLFSNDQLTEYKLVGEPKKTVDEVAEETTDQTAEAEQEPNSQKKFGPRRG